MRAGLAALAIVISAAVLLAGGWLPELGRPRSWSEEELRILRTLWLGSLPPPPADPSNAVAANEEAAALGHQLFFDPRLSGNGEVSCASCHQPAKGFADGLDKAQAIGQSRRNTLSPVGAAHSPWLYWDGRRDSLWSQALSPLEEPAEQGGNRMAIVRLISDDPQYRRQYQRVFGEAADFSDRGRFPPSAAPGLGPELEAAWFGMAAADRELVNRVFANAGKAIAAYERLLAPGPSRFDAYAESLLAGEGADPASPLLDNDEIRGLRLFIGEARCVECHNGPLFTNNEFHNTGILSYPGELPDRGRSDGLRELMANPFNCLGPYSDAAKQECRELAHARRGSELLGAFRTPSLRNLHGTAPYMHKGQMQTLAEALAHYNRAPSAMIGHNEAKPLGLRGRQLRQLEAFLGALEAPLAVEEKWLLPPQ